MPTPLGMQHMEVEMEHARPSAKAQQQEANNGYHSVHATNNGLYRPQHPIDKVFRLVRLLCELYPITSSILSFAIVGIVLFFVGRHIRMNHLEATMSTRHSISHDYTKIEYDFNFRASQMEHWCLFGRDDACVCEDFNDPVPRTETKGWENAHVANMQRIDPKKDYDVVFFGDDVVELWNGKWYNQPVYKTAAGSSSHTVGTTNNGNEINQLWNETFTREGGGELEGLALGIYGDSTSNLLWRLQHGELPLKELRSKVWWILVGSNDLARGGCSEEATVLGILRISEEIHYHHPFDIIVIQGILPRSNRPDGSLTPSHTSGLSSLFSKTHRVKEGESTTELMAENDFLLWPSIVNINKELEKFCALHEHTVYFDASKLFLGSMGNAYYKQKKEEIVRELMPDFVHPSLEGYRVMGTAIAEEVNRIIYEEDESNDVEGDSGRRQRQVQELDETAGTNQLIRRPDANDRM